jgi:uncharacterized membrane protein YgcG
VQRIHRTAATCPHCGFALEDADRLFGAGATRIRRLTDAAGLLRRPEREWVERELRRFGAAFPQLFLAVHTAALSDPASVRQFGFWLLNRAVFEDLGDQQTNEAGVLLVIDAESKAAGLTYGYLLDPFLSEADTFKCLSKAHPYLLEGDYRQGIGVVRRVLEKVLRRRCWQARRNPRRFERAVAPAARVSDLVQRIRFGGGPAGPGGAAA